MAKCSLKFRILHQHQSLLYSKVNAIFSGFDHGNAWGSKLWGGSLSLAQTGICTFEFSCLCDFCEIESLLSKSSLLLDVGACCRIWDTCGWQGAK